MEEQSTPRAGSEFIRAKMQAQRVRDTKPEIMLRRVLHARGVRFRLSGKLPPLPRRTADIVWAQRRVAVFVDGCFWHGCPEHFVLPKTHSEWWQEKIDRNRRRDEETSETLVATGWSVLRIWEHVPATQAADAVEAALEAPQPRVLIVT